MINSSMEYATIGVQAKNISLDGKSRYNRNRNFVSDRKRPSELMIRDSRDVSPEVKKISPTAYREIDESIDFSTLKLRSSMKNPKAFKERLRNHKNSFVIRSIDVMNKSNLM